MQKTIRIGTVSLGYGNPVHLFCSIKFEAGRLSITGVEGPKRNGDAVGSCGQIIMSPWNIVGYAPGWNPETVTRFREVWDHWHLNDMRAGSPAQMAHLRAHPVEYRLHYYFEAALDSLRAAGLQPDRGYMVPDKNGNPQPYSYGSAWLREEVPADVVAFLQGLPDADITPAWV